jgi:hypothetical protein
MDTPNSVTVATDGGDIIITRVHDNIYMNLGRLSPDDAHDAIIEIDADKLAAALAALDVRPE